MYGQTPTFHSEVTGDRITRQTNMLAICGDPHTVITVILPEHFLEKMDRVLEQYLH